MEYGGRGNWRTYYKCTCYNLLQFRIHELGGANLQPSELWEATPAYPLVNKRNCAHRKKHLKLSQWSYKGRVNWRENAQNTLESNPRRGCTGWNTHAISNKIRNPSFWNCSGTVFIGIDKNRWNSKLRLLEHVFNFYNSAKITIEIAQTTDTSTGNPKILIHFYIYYTCICNAGRIQSLILIRSIGVIFFYVTLFQGLLTSKQAFKKKCVIFNAFG